MEFFHRIDDALAPFSGPRSRDLRALLERLSDLSLRGLAQMYDPTTRSFPHTLRGGRIGGTPVAEGMNVRYTAIAALGLSRSARPDVRRVLDGGDVADLLPSVLGLSLAGRDPGAVALALWATIEVTGGDLTVDPERTERAVDRLLTTVRTDTDLPTVDHAWTLAALVAAAHPVTDGAGAPDVLLDAAEHAAGRLMAAQGPGGLFPHHVPADRLSRVRAHVACFADQAYAVQALCRYAAATGESRALEAAARCAQTLCDLQGDQGQWWWHYDWRHGTVVERYPVYSVHQHAMAPMALMELREAGGPDHRDAIARGLSWLRNPPEIPTELIDDALGIIWRKVGRRDPRKVVRGLRAAASARRPERRLPWLDGLYPADAVDRECRPYELGWLLYTWNSRLPAAYDLRDDEARRVAGSTGGANAAGGQ
jgi:hypothetical protein